MATETANRLEPNSDLGATHRLPTVSAADALEDADEGLPTHLPTGVAALDRALADLSPLSEQRGGVVRGQVTEIWGPPGVGKTALGIQLAANALVGGHDVVWVDCFHPLYFSRLSAVSNSVRAAWPSQVAPNEGAFVHYYLQTLPHVLALLCRPRAATFSRSTRLIIIDSFSALLNSYLPKGPDPSSNSIPNAPARPCQRSQRDRTPMTSAKRIQTLQYVVSALQKLAATRDCAVVVLSQCATRMQRSEKGATLVAAINATVWDHGITSRVVLFRDWAWAREENTLDKRGLVGLRFAGLQKLNGKSYDGGVGHVAAFDVNTNGLVNAHHDVDQQPAIKITTPRKRKLGYVIISEIPDSDGDGADEDFSWGEDDEEAFPVMPPQWQGSEDLIVGTQRESDTSSDVENENSGAQDGTNQDRADDPAEREVADDTETPPTRN